MMKNARDIVHEEHHHPIKWIKRFLMGALGGAVFGYSWFIIKPINSFTYKKLFQSIGDRPWSGRGVR